MRSCRLAIAAVMVMSAVAAFGAKDSPISVFGFQLMDYAKAGQIPVAEAAQRFRDAGVTGFDCDYADPFIADLVQAGMKPVNFYADIKFLAPDNGARQIDECLASAAKWQVKLVMVLPEAFSGKDDEAEFARIASGFNLLVSKAAKQGITVTTEDYGWHLPGTQNACGYSKWILRLLKECPGLKFTVDTGNLMYTEGPSAIYPLTVAAADVIVHCHLKDLTEENGKKIYRTLGQGTVPNERIVRFLEKKGYQGWYTLENLVGDDLLADTKAQVKVLKSWR